MFSPGTTAGARLLRTGILCAALSTAFGSLAIFGWAMGVEQLYGRFFADSAATTPLPAICLILTGLGLWLRFIRRGEGDPEATWWQRAIAQGLTWTVLATCAASTLFWLAGWDFVLADWSYQFVTGDQAIAAEAQMPLLSTVCLFLLAGARVLVDRRIEERWSVVALQAMCGLAAMGGAWGCLEFVLEFRHESQISLYTSVACLALAFGTLLLRPTRWLADTMFSPGQAGRLARMLPLAVMGPILVGAIPVHLEKSHILGVMEAELYLILLLVLSVGAMYWIALRFVRAVELRAQTERKLHDQEARYKLIVETSRDGIAIINAAEEVVYITRRMEEMLAYPPGELLGRKPTDFMDPDVVMLLPEIREQCKDGRSDQHEWHLRRSDGSFIWVLASGSPLYLDGGTLDGILFTVTDITQRKVAEADQTRLQGQLLQSQKMEAVGTLAGGIAHDFNNVLAAIVGYTELANDCGNNPVELAEYHSAVMVAAGRATALVRQILMFSRQMATVRRPVQPSQVVVEVRQLLRAALPSTISIKVHDEAAEAVVLIDPTQLHQVLMNLCTNAGFAMRENGGKLRIGLHTEQFEPEHLVPKLGLSAGSYVVISVEDTGPGIPPEIRERIFDPFFTTKAVGEGTGLGLSTVHGIVKDVGGAITLYSEVGLGTTFRVYLPRTDQTKDAEAATAKAPTRGDARVLFLDDEPALAELGKLSLEKMGYQVTGFTIPEQALNVFALDPEAFDVVVTDQTMPGLTGLEVATRLLATRPDLPVIICSGFSHTLTEDQALAAGVVKFLPKPFSGASLHAAIQAALSQVQVTRRRANGRADEALEVENLP